MDEKGKVKYRKLCKKPLSIKYQRQLSSTSSSDPKVKKLKKSGIRYGFNRNLEAEKIFAAKMVSKKLMFLIKWKNINEADLVSSIDANRYCPQLVIHFYEKHLIWKTRSRGKNVVDFMGQ